MTLPVFRVLAWGCCDGIRAARQFPFLVALVVAASLAHESLYTVLQAQPWRPEKPALELIVSLASGVLVMPCWIAMYRFLPRGDDNPHSGMDVGSRRLRLSVGVYVVAILVASLPFIAAETAIDAGDGSDGVATAALIAFVVFMAFAAALTILLTLVFPAIAVDAAEPFGVLRLIRGEFWRFLLIGLLSLLPLLALEIAINALWPVVDLDLLNARRWTITVVRAILLAVFDVALLGLSSRLYVLLVETPAEPASPARAAAT